METADIALMGDDLLKLPEAIALITVSLLLLGVLLGGVTMSIGMLVHEASVLIVILNAMRLLRRSRPRISIAAAESDLAARKVIVEIVSA